jgi:hypothetical protein
MKMALDLISEALDADDIIQHEIERAGKDELDVALEAFSSDEVLPVGGEPEVEEEAHVDAIKEIGDILGVDSSKGSARPVTGVEKEKQDAYDDELDALDHLFAVMSEDEDDN